MRQKGKEICIIEFKLRIGFAKDLQRIKCMGCMMMIVFEFQFHFKKKNKY